MAVRPCTPESFAAQLMAYAMEPVKGGKPDKLTLKVVR
jgi:hypothetical protein